MTTVPDFDRMYASDPDPWQVATSWYERRKIDIALACLRRPRYRFAWDAACGTGDLAARLADRCDAVLASDASAQACALTAARCAQVPQVRVEQSALPALPAGLQAGPRVGPGPDLVVLSEFLYYLDDEARARTAARVADVAAPEADLLAVHWTPQPEDAHLSGCVPTASSTTPCVPVDGGAWSLIRTPSSSSRSGRATSRRRSAAERSLDPPVTDG